MKKFLIAGSLVVASVSMASAWGLDAVSNAVSSAGDSLSNAGEAATGLMSDEPVITVQKASNASHASTHLVGTDGTSGGANGYIMLKNAPSSINTKSEDPSKISIRLDSRQMGGCYLESYDVAGGHTKIERDGTKFVGSTYLSDVDGYDDVMVKFLCTDNRAYNAKVTISYSDDSGNPKEMSRSINF